MTETVEPISDETLMSIELIIKSDPYYIPSSKLQALQMIARIRTQEAEIDQLREALRPLTDFPVPEHRRNERGCMYLVHYDDILAARCLLATAPEPME